MRRSIVVVLLSSLLCAVACQGCGPPSVDGGVVLPDGGAPVGDVGINELLASNAAAIADSHADFDDWLELHNRGDADVDLSGFGLSDDVTTPARFTFPAGTSLPAGGFLIVWADGEPDETDGDDFHLPFKLSAAGEELLLTDADGAAADHVQWGIQATDVAWARIPDGDGAFAAAPPTPGAPNAASDDAGVVADDAGFAAEDAGCVAVSAELHEVMIDNATTYPDEDGEAEPWIEVLNTGAAAVDFGELAVSDDPAFPRMAPLPDVVVEPGDVLVVWADGDLVDTTSHVLLAPTTTTAALYLSDRCGARVDTLTLLSGTGADVSQGHGPDGGTVRFAAPTPDVVDNGAVAADDAGVVDDAGGIDDAGADGGA